MKTIGISAGIKNNEVIVDRSVVDTVVKLGFLPLVFAPVSLKTMPVPSVNFDALILSDGPDITPIFYNEEPLLPSELKHSQNKLFFFNFLVLSILSFNVASPGNFCNRNTRSLSASSYLNKHKLAELLLK